MSSAPSPPSADVIVIGGGIGGGSVAYHLAALGVRDVLLLERSELACGTTSHSTGNMETYRDDPLLFSMVRYAVESLPGLQSESGQEVGWRNVGRVMYTDSEQRMELLRAVPELGRMRGIEVELLTAKQLAERLPVIDSSEILGGIWVPSDGRVDPSNVAVAYVRAARMRGARVRTRTPVLKIVIRGARVSGVRTAAGEMLECNTVVVAAGLWSSAIVATCDVTLPLYALEHQYLITKPISGVNRNMPLFISYDDQLYGREETGGLIVGSLDDDAIPVTSAESPAHLSDALLNERWEQFEPYLKIAMRRFPVLRTAGVKMLVNGLESFTADGQMLLGPVPGVQGLYCACGFNSNGIALAPAAGKFLAEWIVEGAPSADVSRLDVRRFGRTVASEVFMRERVTEVPGYSCRIHTPADDYKTARNIRLSPIHAGLAAIGAHFISVNGWERPAWIGAAEGPPRAWLETVASEAAAATQGVLAIDRSTDVKIALVGPGADDWLTAHVTAYKAEEESISQVVAFPSPAGLAQAFGRIMPWNGGYLLTADPEQEARLTEWVRTAPVPQAMHTCDVSAGIAMFEFQGPKVAEMLSALLNVSNIQSTLAAKTLHWAGATRVRAVADPAHGSTVLLVPADGAMYVWKRLMAVSLVFGLKPGGFFAQEIKRIELGIPRFGQDITPFDQVSTVFGDKSTLSGEQLRSLKPGAAASKEPMMRIGVAASEVIPGFGTNEAVVLGDRVVGELTSRAGLPGSAETLGLAVIRSDEVTSQSLILVTQGKRLPLRRRSTHWEAAIGGTS